MLQKYGPEDPRRGNWYRNNRPSGSKLYPCVLNIPWTMFINFGIIRVLFAVHFFSKYLETCGKTLEMGDEPFVPGGRRAVSQQAQHLKSRSAHQRAQNS
ncbi:hypothetical protein BJX64DRAFT_133401 [Aspergillus heterothallicus]